jgi:hypothetical protein
MELPGEPGLTMNVYTAPAGSASAERLALLATWAATVDADESAAVTAAATTEG